MFRRRSAMDLDRSENIGAGQRLPGRHDLGYNMDKEAVYTKELPSIVTMQPYVSDRPAFV